MKRLNRYDSIAHRLINIVYDGLAQASKRIAASFHLVHIRVSTRLLRK